MRVIYKCSCNGVLNHTVARGKREPIMCAKVNKCDSTLCGAHANTKCKYKIKLGEI